MKWVGALFLVAASYLLGNAIANDESKQLAETDSLILLLKYMRRRMESERIPLFNVFADFSDQALESNGFMQALCNNKSSKTAWLQALPLLSIDSEALRELTSFGQTLGELPLTEQLLKLDSCLAFLTEKKKALRETLPNKQRATKTVCLLVGVLIAIIML